jgi:UDP-N-acetylglucosamine 2-epimerase (non-hydrolysing)
MIGVVYGTTGELIKLAPLLVRLAERGQPPLTLTTAQQVEQIPAFLEDFDLPAPDVWLARGARGRDLERRADVPAWAATVVRSALRERGQLGRRLRADGRPPALIVHGDTMTTVLGALLGRALRVPVAHVEAGMRSGNLRDPFPEELNRRAAARLVRVNFAPGAGPVANLRAERVRGRIVDTVQNTIRDAIDLAGDASDAAVALPDEPFGVVSLHRNELLDRPDALRAVLELLHAHSRHQPLLFVDHSVTAAALGAHGLDGLFDARFRRIPRLRYFPFIALLRRSRFLVTDSGGCQEECAFLGHPCLIHRAVSEHATGLDTCVVLSRLDLVVVERFLADPERLRVAPPEPEARPTEIILSELERMGALAPAAREVVRA